jgi:hypothetical protein
MPGSQVAKDQRAPLSDVSCEEAGLKTTKPGGPGFVAEISRQIKKTSGVADGTRTHDDRNHNPGLYQLSYSHQKERL